jgi:hypothetical protein
MMNEHIMKISIVIGLILALAIVAGTSLPQSESQATSLDVAEQNQVMQEQVSLPDKASVTITITMTTMPIPSDNENPRYSK